MVAVVLPVPMKLFLLEMRKCMPVLLKMKSIERSMFLGICIAQCVAEIKCAFMNNVDIRYSVSVVYCNFIRKL